jgi:hypothetical protein
MDPASIIGPKVRNFLPNEDTGKQACFELASGFFIAGFLTCSNGFVRKRKRPNKSNNRIRKRQEIRKMSAGEISNAIA